jgi:hypothetical protein
MNAFRLLGDHFQQLLVYGREILYLDIWQNISFVLLRIRNCCRSENVLLFLATRNEQLNHVFILLPIYSCAFKIELSGGLDSGIHCFRCGGTFLC